MISFLVTVCDEHYELSRLLNHLNKVKTSEDEIVVLVDSPKSTPEVSKTLETYKDSIKVINSALNGDFSMFKNSGHPHCSQPWIFQLDADEFLGDSVIPIIHKLLDLNKDSVDLIYISRLNTVSNITLQHVFKWKWHVGSNNNYTEFSNISPESSEYQLLKYYNLIIEESLNEKGEFMTHHYTPIINFPDLQGRIYRNKDFIKWEGKVHERIRIPGSFAVLPDSYFLIHPKDIIKQEAQNKFYSTL